MTKFKLHISIWGNFWYRTRHSSLRKVPTLEWYHILSYEPHKSGHLFMPVTSLLNTY